jgi:predicted adenylyl cyclase CyaB
MKQGSIEVEIKSLLGSFEAAQSLIARMEKRDKNFTLASKSKQLNHYFEGGNLTSLKTLAKKILQNEEYLTFDVILPHLSNYSIRTRQEDKIVLFIIKATVDDTTSSNGTARREFEVPYVGTLDELDALILAEGFIYQAKWSREREEYQYNSLNVCIDKNAGYGYLAEFERIVDPNSDFESVKAKIRDELQKLQLQELPQDRLARMFNHYNKNWSNYYGSEKTFTLE